MYSLPHVSLVVAGPQEHLRLFQKADAELASLAEKTKSQPDRLFYRGDVGQGNSPSSSSAGFELSLFSGISNAVLNNCNMAVPSTATTTLYRPITHDFLDRFHKDSFPVMFHDSGASASASSAAAAKNTTVSASSVSTTAAAKNTAVTVPLANLSIVASPVCWSDAQNNVQKEEDNTKTSKTQTSSTSTTNVTPYLGTPQKFHATYVEGLRTQMMTYADICLVHQEFPSSSSNSNTLLRTQEYEKYCDNFAHNILPMINAQAKVILFTSRRSVGSSDSSSSSSTTTDNELVKIIHQRFNGRVVVCPQSIVKSGGDSTSTTSAANSVICLDAMKFIRQQIFDWAFDLWTIRAKTGACTPELANALFPSALNTELSPEVNSRKKNTTANYDDVNDENEEDLRPRYPSVSTELSTQTECQTQNKWTTKVWKLVSSGNPLRPEANRRRMLKRNSPSSTTYEKYKKIDDTIKDHTLKHPGQGVILAKCDKVARNSFAHYYIVYVTQGVLQTLQKIVVNSSHVCQIEAIDANVPIRKTFRRPARKTPISFATAGMLVLIRLSHERPHSLGGIFGTSVVNNSLISSFDSCHGFEFVEQERSKTATPKYFQNDEDDDDNEDSSPREGKKHNSPTTYFPSVMKPEQQQQQRTSSQEKEHPIFDLVLTRKLSPQKSNLCQPLAITVELLPPGRQLIENPNNNDSVNNFDDDVKFQAGQILEFLRCCYEQEAISVTEYSYNVMKWKRAFVNCSIAGARAADYCKKYPTMMKNDFDSIAKWVESPASRTIQLFFLNSTSAQNERPILPQFFSASNSDHDSNPLILLQIGGALKNSADRARQCVAKVTRIVTDLDIVEDFLCPSAPPPCPNLFAASSSSKQQTASNDDDNPKSESTNNNNNKIVNSINERLFSNGSTSSPPPGCRLGIGFSSPLSQYFLKDVPESLLKTIDPKTWMDEDVDSPTTTRSKLVFTMSKWGRYTLESRYAPFPVCLSRLASVAVCYNLSNILEKMMEDRGRKQQNQDDNEETTTNIQYHPLLPGILKPTCDSTFKQIITSLQNYLCQMILPSCGLDVHFSVSSTTSTTAGSRTIMIKKRIPAILDACCVSMFDWRGTNTGPIFVNNNNKSPSPYRRELFKIAQDNIDLVKWLSTYRWSEFDRVRPGSFSAIPTTTPLCLNIFGEKGSFEFSWLDRDNEDLLAKLPYQLLRMKSTSGFLTSLLVGDDPVATNRRATLRQRKLPLSSSSTQIYKNAYHDSLLAAAVRTWNLDLVSLIAERLERTVLFSSSSSSTTHQQHNELPLIPLVPFDIATNGQPSFKHHEDVLDLLHYVLSNLCMPLLSLQDSFCTQPPFCVTATKTFHRLLLCNARIIIFMKQFTKNITLQPRHQKLMPWPDPHTIKAPQIRNEITTMMNKFTRLMGASVCSRIFSDAVYRNTTVNPATDQMALPSAPISALYWELMRILAKVWKNSCSCVVVRDDDENSHNNENDNKIFLPWEVCQVVVSFLVNGGT